MYTIKLKSSNRTMTVKHVIRNVSLKHVGRKGMAGAQGEQGDTGLQGPQGIQGATGSQGPAGATGATGPGVATGGTTGQILAKNSNTNYDTEWVDPSTGDVISVNGQSGVVVLESDDISDTGQTNKYVTAAEKVKLSNLSGTNTGDQDLSGLVPNTRTVNGHALSSNVTVTKSDVSLGNVDNTSDANKPVSTAQATAIGVVQSDVNAHEARTDNPHSVTKSQVGLANADNTSDLSKPISTLTQAALDDKVDSVVAGVGIDVDDTDPVNPEVSLDSASQVSLALADSAVQNLSDLSITASAAELNILDGATLTTTELNYVDGVTSAIQTQINGKQASDTDLTDIAALTPTNDDLLQRKAGAWTNRTPAQVKTDLALVKGDVGLGNVDNTSNATERAATRTLTNARITKRTGTTTSSATPTINTDNVDLYSLTAQTADITSFTTNLSGTPTEGQTLWVAITGTAARAITWGASFEASTVALPTTTVTTARLDVGFVWNSVTSKWRCVATA